MGHTYEQLSAKFELGDTLGTGAFSEVKIATERATGNKYAIKIVDKSKCKGKESMIETEVNILMRVRHEHIIQLYEMYEIESKIYLVMELVTGGELFDEIVKIGKYTEADAAHIVYKILLAIDYLHTEGIAHRDLKPENLLLSDRTSQAKIMISDFGLSKIFSDDEVMRTACGTPGYVAPEVLKRQGYGREVDLWSLGVITYILLCGYPPFYDQNNVELFKQIMAGRYEFDRPWWDNISETAKDFIRKLLVLDPRQRATARSCLNHPFITNNCGVHPNVSQAAGSHLAQQDTSTHSVPPLRPEPMNAQYYNPQAHSETASTSSRSSNNRSSGSSQRHSNNPTAPSSSSSTPPSSSPAAAATQAHTAPAPHQQPNLAPSVQQNLQKAQSFKGNSHQSVHQDKHQHAAAIRLSADDASQPGRPLGVKSSLDDSGCVTSNDSISGRKASTSTQDRSSVHSHTTIINRPSTLTRSIPSTPPIRFLSYNIHLRPPSIPKPPTPEHKNARLQAFMQTLERFDVVCLQEMFSSGSSRMSKLLVQAKKAGFDFYCCSPTKSMLNSAVDGGLVILSRFPIVKTEKTTFKKGVMGDKNLCKGAIYSKIKVSPHQYIHIINTHLQSSSSNISFVTAAPPSKSFEEADKVRQEQLYHLKDFIDDCIRKNSTDSDLLLVSGGFNINARTTRANGKDHSKDYVSMLHILNGTMEEIPSRPVTPRPTSLLRRRSSVLPVAKSTPLHLDVKDLMFEALHKIHPVTFGDVVDAEKRDYRPVERVLTAQEAFGACASIDYVLCMRRTGKVGELQRKVVVDLDASRVEKFAVANEPFTHISDHYGFSTVLRILEA